MEIPINKPNLFLYVASNVLLLACLTPSVHGQYRDPNSRPSPTPTPAPPSRPLRPINPSQMSGRLSQDVNQLPGTYGQIRWKKELGLPSTDSGMTADTTNCGAIRVSATFQER